MEGLVILGLALSFLGYFVYSIYQEIQADNQWQRDEAEAKLKWEQEQAKLPSYRLKVITNSGQEYFSEPVEPYRFMTRSRYGFKIESTSQERACKQANRVLEDGGFQDPVTGTVIPSCSIKEIKVEEIK